MAQENLLEAAAKEPITARDRIIGGIIALVLIGFCVGVWLAPDLVGVDTSELSGRKGRSVGNIVNLLWSRPAGTIAGALGLLMAWGVLMKGSGGDAQEEAGAEMA